MRRRHRNILPTLSRLYPHITGATIADLPPDELAFYVAAAAAAPPLGHLERLFTLFITGLAEVGGGGVNQTAVH